MKQVSVIISTYTADVSGVCSALYELGGMVVIHDPSGCNSTYNTHDEPRWYEQDSLVFISGLSEIDAIMGDDDKLIADIIRAAGDLSPRFIALVRTPVPWMTGTDFEAIQRILERETGLPVFYFPTCGMHSYVRGAGMALAAVAAKLVNGPEKNGTEKNAEVLKKSAQGASINLLGVTPLDFSINRTLSSMISFFENHGHPVISTFAMGSTAEQIARAGEAAVNVVVSSVGLAAARVLQERFGTPYVVGMPVEPFADQLLSDLKKSARDGVSRIAYHEMEECSGKPVYFIGEAVIMESLAMAFRMRYGLQAEVICPLEVEEEKMLTGIHAESEEEIQEILSRGAAVIADPMYRPIAPENIPFFPLPHEAFSGRIYRRQIPDLTDLCFLDDWIISAL